MVTMTAPFSSTLVHKLVVYIKSAGFDLETDELRQIGCNRLLREEYGILLEIPRRDIKLLEQELLVMAEANEVRESVIKTSETNPVDMGVMVFYTPHKQTLQQATQYPMIYSYPVDKNIAAIRPQRAVIRISKMSLRQTQGVGRYIKWN